MVVQGDWKYQFSVFDDYLIDDKGYRENVLFLLGIIFSILIQDLVLCR